MKLHFFTVRNIEDYHNSYKHSTEAHDLLKKTTAQTVEEFDQEFFSNFILNAYHLPKDVFESPIYGKTGIEGLRLDFNFGLRLDIPEGNFRIRISDFDSGQIFLTNTFPVAGYFLQSNILFVGTSKFFWTTRKFSPTRSIPKDNKSSSDLKFLRWVT